MNKWLIAAGVATVMAVSAWAEPGQHGGGPGPGGHRGGGLEARIQALLQDETFVKEVGLTDDQVKSVSDALYVHQKDQVKLQADVELAQLDVKNLMNQDTPDHDALMKAVDKAGAAMTALRKSDIENRLKIRGIVGPDALKKIKAKMREMAKAQCNGPGGRGQGRWQQGPGGQGHGSGPVSENDQGPGGGDNGATQAGPAPWMDETMQPPEDI